MKRRPSVWWQENPVRINAEVPPIPEPPKPKKPSWLVEKLQELRAFARKDPVDIIAIGILGVLLLFCVWTLFIEVSMCLWSDHKNPCAEYGTTHETRFAIDGEPVLVDTKVCLRLKPGRTADDLHRWGSDR